MDTENINRGKNNLIVGESSQKWQMVYVILKNIKQTCGIPKDMTVYLSSELNSFTNQVLTSFLCGYNENHDNSFIFNLYSKVSLFCFLLKNVNNQPIEVFEVRNKFFKTVITSRYFVIFIMLFFIKRIFQSPFWLCPLSFFWS